MHSTFLTSALVPFKPIHKYVKSARRGLTVAVHEYYTYLLRTIRVVMPQPEVALNVAATFENIDKYLRLRKTSIVIYYKVYYTNYDNIIITIRGGEYNE